MVYRSNYCDVGRWGGLCVGKLLFEGIKVRVKGTDPLVNKVRGYRGESAVKRVEVFVEGFDITFHLAELEVVFVEFFMHRCAYCVFLVSGLA